MVDGGLKVVEQALQGIFSGANTGELLKLGADHGGLITWKLGKLLVKF